MSLRNPITEDFFIPTLRPGYERLFVNLRGRLTQADLNALGLPNGIPLVDLATSSGVQGGVPLVRQRNVVPSEFQQDQFSTRLSYNLLKGNSEGGNANTLSGTLFFANFPGLDPFPDDSLASPAPLIKDDRSRTLAVSDTHVLSATLINEARFGYFFLDNSRQLDPRLLQSGLTSPDFGLVNPASAFAPGPETLRLPRFGGTRNLRDFSLGAPNDIFNRREQVTLTFADNFTYTRGNHTLRSGIEYKRNSFDTSLPEEQGGEYEGIRSFLSVLTGIVPEVDTAFGITDKQFRFNDLSLYVSDDWRFSNRLKLNLGLRWDWFGRPFEKNGRFANFDFSRVTNPNDITPGFTLPSNARETGFNAIDASLPTIDRADNIHTLNGEDLNNFAPRVGFAFKPFHNDKTVIRGGYGIFYDRPSAAFINTVYSNYPFLREIENINLFNPRAVSARTTLSEQNPNLPFSSYFPFRIAFTQLSSSTAYYLFDNTPGIRSTTGINDETTQRPPTGNLVEPVEFRAIDRDLKTPLIQQWNLGLQQQFGNDWAIEMTYVGTRGQNLLLAVGFNQPYDLNDASTPDFIFKRLNDVYARTPRALSSPLRTGVSERERGRAIAYGDCNFAFFFIPGNAPCFNSNYSFDGRSGFDFNIDPFSEGRDIINADLRVPYLGLDPQDAVILQSRGYSSYHSGQLNLTKRFSRGYGLNVSYTFSKSIDIGSTDPGSTTASGRPDTPNLGLVVQGDQRDINSNRAVSDFDRSHRFAASFVLEIPTFGTKSKLLTGWQLSAFGQWQSGTPFSIIASDPEFLPTTSGGILTFQSQYRGVVPEITGRNLPNGTNVRIGGLNFNAGTGTGSLYRAAFARPDVRSLELLRQRQEGSDQTREFFNTCQDPDNPACPFLAPFGGFGNLGRNVLRGPSQKRIDFSLQRSIRISERVILELKWDVFNVFNFVNFANPNSDLSDETDFGQITRTVGAPRVMQFGAKLRF